MEINIWRITLDYVYIYIGTSFRVTPTSQILSFRLEIDNYYKEVKRMNVSIIKLTFLWILYCCIFNWCRWSPLSHNHFTILPIYFTITLYMSSTEAYTVLPELIRLSRHGSINSVPRLACSLTLSFMQLHAHARRLNFDTKRRLLLRGFGYLGTWRNALLIRAWEFSINLPYSFEKAFWKIVKSITKLPVTTLKTWNKGSWKFPGNINRILLEIFLPVNWADKLSFRKSFI